MVQIPLIKELVCYVCGKGVSEADSVRVGGGLRRHRKCKPAVKSRREGRVETSRRPQKQTDTEPSEDRLFP
ncbi:MAG TPA: hypothetical protein DCR97_03475 [Deltaproteobacteria bacterium]|nr:hypothetical protein [Deltaproteobacteria bacterium]